VDHLLQEPRLELLLQNLMGSYYIKLLAAFTCRSAN